MTVSDTQMTHAAAVMDHVASIASVASQTVLTAGTFKTGVVTSYSPDGQEKAMVGNLSLANVAFASDGSITGGSIVHSAATPEGQPISSSTLQLTAGGRPSQVQTQIHNKRDAGLAKTLSADFSGVKWTEAGNIASGQMKVTTNDAATGKRRSAGSLVFQNEKLVSSSITHYSPQDENTVAALTDLDYSGVAFSGMKVMGGQMKVTRKTPDQSVSSTSQVEFAENGLGRVKQIQTANLTPGTSAVKSNVTSDYSGLSYNARNEITSGSLTIAAKAADKSPLTHSVVTFANSVPATAQTWRFQGGVVAAQVVTDFSKSQFDNDGHVVNSSKQVDLYDGSGRQVSSTIVTHGPTGAVVNKQVQPLPPAAATATPKTYAELLAALKSTSVKTTNPVSAAAAGATGPAPAATPTGADIKTATKDTLRSDGTLETRVVTTSQKGSGNSAAFNSVVVSADVTHYDTDGKTVVNTHHVDFTKLVITQGQTKPSGSVAVQEKTGGSILHSESVFNYA